MRFGRQEDAHDFLRCFIDSLQNGVLAGFGKYVFSFVYSYVADNFNFLLNRLDNAQKESTIIHQIFGGYVRSQVLCSVCKKPSNIVETLLDLSLEIKNANSIEKALDHFFKAELLNKDNRYKCSK